MLDLWAAITIIRCFEMDILTLKHDSARRKR